MNGWDWLLTGLIAAAVLRGLGQMRRKGGCCGCCGDCAARCGRREQDSLCAGEQKAKD